MITGHDSGKCSSCCCLEALNAPLPVTTSPSSSIRATFSNNAYAGSTFEKRSLRAPSVSSWFCCTISSMIASFSSIVLVRSAFLVSKPLSSCWIYMKESLSSFRFFNIHVASVKKMARWHITMTYHVMTCHDDLWVAMTYAMTYGDMSSHMSSKHIWTGKILTCVIMICHQVYVISCVIATHMSSWYVIK